MKKFSLGYDFEGINYIIFTDSKTTYEDIIQSIGRGTRSDKLGANGKNKDKTLYIDIPVYYKDDDSDDDKYEYKKLREVLRYLMLDLEIEWNDLLIKDKKNKKDTDKKPLQGIKYDGTERIRLKLLDIMKGLKPFTTYKKFVEMLQTHNVTSNVEYYKFYQDNKIIGIPQVPQIKYKEQGFCWYNIIKDEIKQLYYDPDECISRIIEIKNELEDNNNEFFDDEDDHEEILKFLNQKDKKIPNKNLWEFYGRDKKDFYVF